MDEEDPMKEIEERMGEFSEDDIEVPDEPGPAILGRKPLVGSVRRSMGFPVLRDEIEEEM